MKSKLILTLAFLFILKAGHSQSEVADFIRAGKDDATKLIQAYLNPYALALGDGLNNGWYNSAATHKLFGMDLAINVSAVMIPSSGQTFNVNEIGLSNNTRLISGSPNAPTVAGPENDGPRMGVYLDNTEVVTFNTPQGTGFDMVPVPMAQLTLGILPKTDLSIRYVPELSFDDDEIKVGMIGGGLKHNFKESLPFLKHLPFDASVYLNFSTIDASGDLMFGAEEYDFEQGISVQNNYTQDDNQQLKFKTKTFGYGLVVSKKLSVLTVYASAGKNKSQTDIDLEGSYPFIKDGDTFNEVVIYGETDPVQLDFESSNLALSAGLRLKLAFFSLYGSVNKSEYTSYNAGISLGFR